jgi:hypothetical protein
MRLLFLDRRRRRLLFRHKLQALPLRRVGRVIICIYWSATTMRVLARAGTAECKVSARGWLWEVIERTALTRPSTSRACSRSPPVLTSRPAPSSVNVHASTGAFILINSHLSTSPKRAKSTGSSHSASLPITHMSRSSATVSFSSALLAVYFGRATEQAGERRCSAHQRSTSR